MFCSVLLEPLKVSFIKTIRRSWGSSFRFWKYLFLFLSETKKHNYTSKKKRLEEDRSIQNFGKIWSIGRTNFASPTADVAPYNLYYSRVIVESIRNGFWRIYLFWSLYLLTIYIPNPPSCRIQHKRRSEDGLNKTLSQSE